MRKLNTYAVVAMTLKLDLYLFFYMAIFLSCYKNTDTA